jgi:hypothetical protein
MGVKLHVVSWVKDMVQFYLTHPSVQLTAGIVSITVYGEISTLKRIEHATNVLAALATITHHMEMGQESNP